MSQKISALPVGAKVRDTKTKYYGVPIPFQIGDKNHAGYPSNSTTLVVEKIIKLCCFDATESGGNSDRQNWGNNRMVLANLRQWLNKSGTGWYQAQHSYDRPPSNAYVWSNYNEYDGEAGFLTGFGPEMLAALLTTTLTVAKPTVDGGGSETFQDKVFLLSMAEVGLGSENGISEGSKLALFSDNNSRKAYPTAQAVSNSEYTNSSLSASQPWYWWLRSPHSSDAYYVRYVYSDGSLGSNSAYYGYWGVRPALNLSSDILVSDSPDSEGYYTIIWNNNPNTPPSITVPEMVRSGKNLTVTWAASVDPDGDAVSYELERQYNGGGWSNVYSGSATTFTDTGITGSMNTVAYRVRAKDSKDAYSAYTTSPTRTVTHNVDPTISGTDQNLGVVSTPPSYQYTVGDTDEADILEVVESLDGVEVRTIEEAVRGTQYTFALTAAQFSGLTGQHTMTIKVTDSAGNSVTRTITFTRTVTRIDFDWKIDDTSAAAEKILVSMRYNAHEDGVVLKVCNNYNDASPTWETATVGLKHMFSNQSKTADSWAVGVRVTIEKTSGWDAISCYSLSASYI